MANLTDVPAFTADEVYEIQATDPVEGAADGASFSGIGLDNQPHQQLANRTSFLKGRQDVNIVNIAELLAFQAQFISNLQANGYIKLGAADISRGAIQPILQWGFYSLKGQTPTAVKNAPWTVTFPLAFPTACFFFQPQLVTNRVDATGALSGGSIVIESGPVTKTQAIVYTDWDELGTIYVASGAQLGLLGFSWFAIGF